ncbi:MAG TPA: glycosyltransferase family 4 protein [Actinomycetota bacterium]|nr:glycosyltransferase family 4 protein [Actinomycetota bacterium]
MTAVRILHVSWEYPPLVYGGLGRHVPSLAAAQAAAGHDVWVITQRTSGAPDDDVVDGVNVLRRANTPVLEFVPENLHPWVTDLDGQLAAGAMTAMGEEPPDVVHCHDWMTTITGTTLANTLGTALVATIHATERGRHQGNLPGEISLRVDAVERTLCQRADRVIACSQAMQAEVIAQFDVPEAKVAVIPNGIAPEEWRSSVGDRAVARARWAPDGPLVVFVGRLEVEKGILELAEAMVEVAQRLPGARLIVSGKGSQTQRFHQACVDLGISGLVTMPGWLPEKDLRALIGCADVAVIPSLYEPFGLVALEAMALAVPVVASHVGGLSEFVRQGETGWSVPPRDAGALARAIVAAVTDQGLAQAQVERATLALARDFSWSKIAATTVDVYRTAMSASASMARHRHLSG